MNEYITFVLKYFQAGILYEGRQIRIQLEVRLPMQASVVACVGFATEA